MVLEQMWLRLLILGITLISGLADAQGVIHGAQAWRNGTIVWDELAKSATGFALGIGMYWLSLRYMQMVGIMSPLLPGILWFGVTLAGVAIANGQFLQWRMLDQVVAVGVLIGIGWLLVRAPG